jgi:hypothetical protein
MTPQLARRILALSAVLGLLANWLLKVNSWSAGFVLWVLLVLGVAFYVEAATESEPTARRDRRILYGTAGALALLLVLRDAESLYAVNFFAFMVVLFLVAWRASGRSLTQLEPRDALIGIGSSVTAAVAGAPTLALRDADAKPMDASTRRSYRGFGIGSLVAAPVLLVVTALLASADPLFAGFVEHTGELLELSLVGDLVFIGAVSWLTAGALRGSLVPVGINGTMFRRELGLPFASVLPLFGGLALLLSAWIGLQVRALFGGAAYVAATADMTVANYARQGFFELIVIAGIVLAALLVADDVLERNAESERKSFRILGQVLVALVGAVLVSAVSRLALYLQFYGLTDDRVLALAVLVWVAIVLTWFALTVLRGQRARFATGVLVLSVIWLGAFNAVNPERRIVETNLRRAEQGMEFDVAYHARLSGDALPALLRGADRLDPAVAAELRAAVKAQWAKRAESRSDWRMWSLPYVLSARQLEQ